MQRPAALHLPAEGSRSCWSQEFRTGVEGFPLPGKQIRQSSGIAGSCRSHGPAERGLVHKSTGVRRVYLHHNGFSCWPLTRNPRWISAVMRILPDHPAVGASRTVICRFVHSVSSRSTNSPRRSSKLSSSLPGISSGQSTRRACR